MFLTSVSIRNYKSLRRVVFQPRNLACLVGPNSAGKTNLTDALHFLSEVYRHGLEVAITRKGGYENIAFRRQRRSRTAVEFEVVLSSKGSDLMTGHLFNLEGRAVNEAVRVARSYEVRYTHRFSFVARGQNIRADYEVVSDKVLVDFRKDPSEGWQRAYEIAAPITDQRLRQLRITVGVRQKALFADDEPFLEFLSEFTSGHKGRRVGLPVDAQSLLISSIGFGLSSVRMFLEFVSNFRVFRLTPSASRSPGIPTPNPALGESGENLPAIVEWLRAKYEKLWHEVIDGMQEIMPTLSTIDTQYVHTKALGLVFEEEGFRRKWQATDVSDGTIQALAIMVAMADPRASLLMIEELENSLHGWAIRSVIKRLQAVSESRNVILTTHSPIVVDQMEPEQLWVVFRNRGETNVKPVTELGDSVSESWRSGAFTMSEYLDSGVLGQAVPGGVF